MIKVLIVDDSICQLKFLENILNKSGFQVLSTDNPGTVLKMVQNYHPQIIILDILLKGISGWQICRQLKNHFEFKNIPIIMCSSKSTQLDKIWTQMVGANEHLSKPIQPTQLITKIKELIEH